MRKSVISIEHVCYSYPLYRFNGGLKSLALRILRKERLKREKVSEKLLFQDFSLSLFEGDRLGIYGPNGSGKTTLLRLISGLLVPQKGSIDIHGSVAPMLNLVAGFDGQSTGYENIFRRGLLIGLNFKEIQCIVEEVIDYAELRAVIHDQVWTYSSGMQMRLAFAVTTLCGSDILVLDEWLSVGDEQFQKKTHDTMLQYLNKCSALIIASHSKHTLRQYCTSFLVFNTEEKSWEMKGIL